MHVAQLQECFMTVNEIVKEIETYGILVRVHPNPTHVTVQFCLFFLDIFSFSYQLMIKINFKT